MPSLRDTYLMWDIYVLLFAAFSATLCSLSCSTAKATLKKRQSTSWQASCFSPSTSPRRKFSTSPWVRTCAEFAPDPAQPVLHREWMSVTYSPVYTSFVRVALHCPPLVGGSPIGIAQRRILLRNIYPLIDRLSFILTTTLIQLQGVFLLLVCVFFFVLPLIIFFWC